MKNLYKIDVKKYIEEKYGSRNEINSEIYIFGKKETYEKMDLILSEISIFTIMVTIRKPGQGVGGIVWKGISRKIKRDNGNIDIIKLEVKG